MMTNTNRQPFDQIIRHYQQQPSLTDSDRRAMLKALTALTPHIPHPASGQTLRRWQWLSEVAGVDLTVAKWFESHLDAISILHELGYDTLIAETADSIWAVWAAEGSREPIWLEPISPELIRGENSSDNTSVCTGIKNWCSGATNVDMGLMTYRDSENRSQLLQVEMGQAGITIDNRGWQAVGMQATDTASLQFDHTPVTLIGQADDYLQRAGFWHGAAGVAACWYGATTAIARYLLTSHQQKPTAVKAMYLGQVSSQLAPLASYFAFVAQQIDRQPEDNHALIIRQLRHQVEQTAQSVMQLVGQALGAAPFCQDAHFAQLTADLTVFIRQTHGAYDEQAIGDALIQHLIQQSEKLKQGETLQQENPWQL